MTINSVPSSKVRVRIGHLYGDLLNLYADRGNILVLTRRCEWRNIAVEVVSIGVGDRIGSGDFDILFMGGGQDGDQQFLEDDLFRVKADGLRGAVHDGVPVLAVCGSYQLLGHYYDPGTGPRLAGLGIFDMHTVHPGLSVRRCIGDVVVDWIGAPVGGPSSVVGFENHGGRTYIGSGARAFGRVVSGNGNNGEDGTEGVVQANAIGTYLHGSLLPKNPHLADHLIGMALARQTGSAKLEPLDDHLEWQAHQTILDRRASHVAPVGGRVKGSGGSAR